MDKQLFETLLNKTEGEGLDFKSEQYKLDTEEQKAEFIKDILAFANAWKTSDAYIICGIIEKDGRADQIKGVNLHLKDKNLQQLVCSKTNGQSLDMNLLRMKGWRYNPDYTKELKEYLQFKKMFAPINFIMQNAGASTAYDVKTELRISKKQLEDILELGVFLHYALIKPPSEDKFDSLAQPTLNKDAKRYMISKETEYEYVFEISFGKIQPKYTLESKGFLYLRAFTPLEFEMHTKTFADNLPNPIEKTSHFKVEVKEENYSIETEYEDKKTE
jgi:hypothetical protein